MLEFWQDKEKFMWSQNRYTILSRAKNWKFSRSEIIWIRNMFYLATFSSDPAIICWFGTFTLRRQSPPTTKIVKSRDLPTWLWQYLFFLPTPFSTKQQHQHLLHPFSQTFTLGSRKPYTQWKRTSTPLAPPDPLGGNVVQNVQNTSTTRPILIAPEHQFGTTTTATSSQTPGWVVVKDLAAFEAGRDRKAGRTTNPQKHHAGSGPSGHPGPADPKVTTLQEPFWRYKVHTRPPSLCTKSLRLDQGVNQATSKRSQQNQLIRIRNSRWYQDTSRRNMG